MKRFDQASFDNFVLDNVIGISDKKIKLASGRESHIYFNWRTPCEDAYLIDKITDYILDFASDISLKPNTFYGVPEGATKLGLIAQFKYAKRDENFINGKYALSMGRGKLKNHGDSKDKNFLGVPKGKTVILEDVTTTAASLLEEIIKLRELNVDIWAALALTNRNEITPIHDKDDKTVVSNFANLFYKATNRLYKQPMSVKQVMKLADVPYFAMSNGYDLTYRKMFSSKISEDIVKSIETEFEEYGLK